MATGSHQWKACWFLLIVSYHREIIDRDWTLQHVSPKPHRTELEEKQREQVCLWETD